jgi:hypothetical protein
MEMVCKRGSGALGVAFVALLSLSCGDSQRSAGDDARNEGMSGSATGASGGTGEGGGGALGGSGAAPSDTCRDGDGDGANPSPNSYRKTRATTTGLNGAFTDECDADGNLVEYACESECRPTPGSDIITDCHRTGNVVRETWDCGGRCVDGTGPLWCPEDDDLLAVESVNGDTTVFRDTSGAVQTCIHERLAGSYDCRSSTLVGREFHVYDANCGGFSVRLIVDDPANGRGIDCTYDCNL